MAIFIVAGVRRHDLELHYAFTAAIDINPQCIIADSILYSDWHLAMVVTSYIIRATSLYYFCVKCTCTQCTIKINVR